MEKAKSQPAAELKHFIRQALGSYEEWNGGGEEWRSPFWELVRVLKGHEALVELDGWRAWRAITRMISWEEIAVIEGRVDSENEDDVSTAFMSAWDNCKYGIGDGFLRRALEQANRQPVMLRRERGRGFKRFVALALVVAEEAVRSGRDTFCVPQERWAELLGVARQTIATWTRWAAEDGIVTLVKEYSLKERQAGEFKLNLKRP